MDVKGSVASVVDVGGTNDINGVRTHGPSIRILGTGRVCAIFNIPPVKPANVDSGSIGKDAATRIAEEAIRPRRQMWELWS